MILSKAIREECLLARARCSSKEEVLREAARLARQCPVLEGVAAERILEGFRQREAVCSTGIGDGVAIPHCRLPEAEEFVVGMITLAEGVDFDAIDGRKVNIVAFIVAPESDTADHPRILSGLSMRLSRPEGRREILAATSASELWQALQLPGGRQTGEELTRQVRLVHVIVQHAELFHSVLEAVESVDGASAVVLDTSNVGEHLTRLPVFASFLADTSSAFSRMILATVPRALTNEMVRRIESVTGPLAERGDITVVVQDVFMAAGALGV